jgi:RNA polymerase sigma factor (sigma-70 family)
MQPKPNESTTIVISRALDRLKAGDEKARDELIERSQQRMLALSRRYLRRFESARQISDTLDVRQAAVMRLMTALKTVTPNDSRHFFALASQQIRWALLTLCREVQRRVATGGAADETLDPASLQAPDPTRDRPEAWIDFVSLHEALERIDQDLREVVDLYIIQELPRSEVAQVLGVSERQVNRLWLRARVELGRMLAN